jgi:2-polyprenyl-3-methyl-5-hydroxy-6-metoxy-1,4-benzoquinol methylase
VSGTFAENTYGIVKRLEVIRAWLKPLQYSGKTVRVLDYGCGTGDQITYPLAVDGYDVVGVDVHTPSIDAAQSRYRLQNLSFRRVSLEALVEERLRFDAIVCSEVLEHLEDPQGMLVKLRQLLDRDGLLIITTPNGYGSYELLCSLQRLLERTGIHRIARSVFKPKHHGNGSESGFLNQESVHIQFFQLKALEAMFEGCGFHIADRCARTLVCGPYADIVLNAAPFRQALIRWNAAAADVLPLRCAADWMFLLQQRTI